MDMTGDTLLPDRASRGKSTEKPTPPPNEHVGNSQFSPCSPSYAET